MTVDTREEKTLKQHLEEFKTIGFTLFPKMLDDDWVAQMRAALKRSPIVFPTPTAVAQRPL